MYDGDEYFVKGPDGRFLFRATGPEVEWADAPSEATAMDLMRALAFANRVGGTIYPSDGQVMTVSEIGRASCRERV